MTSLRLGNGTFLSLCTACHAFCFVLGMTIARPMQLNRVAASAGRPDHCSKPAFVGAVLFRDHRYIVCADGLSSPGGTRARACCRADSCHVCSSGKDQAAKPGSADVKEGTAAVHSPDLASVLAACKALLGNQESQVSLHTYGHGMPD